MTRKFEDQGGAATSNPSAPLRWIMSRFMRRLADPARLDKQRRKTERARLKAGEPHRVEYFHQVDDAYSHLAAQTLQNLQDRYDIDVTVHLVGPVGGKNAPEPELLLDYAREDSIRVAPHYGLKFPPAEGRPDSALTALATRILAGKESRDFPALAAAAGEALWSGDQAAMHALGEQHGLTDAKQAEQAVFAGTAHREALQHYSSAMFYYGREWYWGVDRLYHLEHRLIELGARKHGVEGLLAPRPAIEAGELKDNGSLTLEFYLSLRSPYTSMIFDETIRLVEATGVTLKLRPVLPMVMRGVPATRQKGVYIFSDAAREARAMGLDWGNSYDPIGRPVRRAYSLYPWAREQGREVELLSAFLRAAWTQRVNTNTDRGLRRVVEDAGLSWADAQSVVDNPDWEDELEDNRLAMYGFGSWGVPSYRLLDADGNTAVTAWGQDRLWLVAREIQRLLTGAGDY